MRLLNVGFGNLVSAGRVVAVVAPDSAPVRRMIQDARDVNRVIDATCGRRTRSVLVLDSEHVVLSPLQPETVAGRLNAPERGEKAQEDED
ncbi:MAG: DUF370 domain-containing protein [Clostridia bacterium]|nr:DUF370 domain-containing protein [Clostridia bacterium]